MNERKIVYTGDTNTINPFLPYIENCNELYIDVSQFGGAHIKIDDVFKMLNVFKSNGINVFLMHIDNAEYMKKFGFNIC